MIKVSDSFINRDHASVGNPPWDLQREPWLRREETLRQPHPLVVFTQRDVSSSPITKWFLGLLAVLG